MTWNRYRLTASQVQGIANLAKQEQGTVEGARAEVCLMANLLEGSPLYRKKYGDDIYKFVRESGWFSRAAYWMDNGDAGEAYRRAVYAVLVDGKRVVPPYVNEHDCFNDIASAKNNGAEIDKLNRAQYRPGVTKIRNDYGSAYTFFCFPTWSSDPFGYTDKKQFVPSADDIINRAETYLGIEEPSGDDYFIRYYNSISEGGYPLDSAWCAIFVSDVYSLMGCSCVPIFAKCTIGREWYIKQGRYMRSKASGGMYTPKRGDTVFYSSYKRQDAANHVGIVVSCDGNYLRAIEGNHHDAVGYRDILLADPYIIGYGRVADFLNEKGDWNGVDVRKFVSNLYTDELFREGTEDEIVAWVDDIDRNGRNPEQVQEIFRNSPEGRAAWVTMLYGAILHREAKPEELSAWVKAMENGESREGVLRDIMNSPEAQKKK